MHDVPVKIVFPLESGLAMLTLKLALVIVTRVDVLLQQLVLDEGLGAQMTGELLHGVGLVGEKVIAVAAARKVLVAKFTTKNCSSMSLQMLIEVRLCFEDLGAMLTSVRSQIVVSVDAMFLKL